MQINGSGVLISGASSGLGAALAHELGRRGARVALLARTATALAAVASTVRAAGGVAHCEPCDLADPAAAAAAAGRAVAAIGPIDILINNAGMGRWLFLHETSAAEAQAMMQVPYFAALHLTRALLPAMQARNRGLILNVNSPASIVAWPGATAYSAARWALRGFTEALSADLYGSNVRVTAVVPGLLATPYFDNNPGVRERIPPLARLLLRAVPAEQAATIIARGIERDQRMILFPGMLRLLYRANLVVPGLVRWLTVAPGRVRQKQNPQ